MQPIPTDIVLEVIGQSSFSNNDIQIAEAIASQEYTSMSDLQSIIKGETKGEKRKKDWDKRFEEMKTNPYFEKYFISHP